MMIKEIINSLSILLVWNAVVFFIYGIDKWKASRNKWRISEKTLILSAFLLGGIGAFFGMKFFRHKTKRTKFKVLLPVAILFNIAIIIGGIYFGKRYL